MHQPWQKAFVAGLIAIVPAALFLAPTSGIAGSGQQETPVILISVDTFRADSLTASGQERNLTPSLDRFVNDSYYFKKAYANAPWTLPSHATVFTGKYPSQSGVIHLNYTICGEERTMAERLKSRGYTTAGSFNGGGPVSREYGFAQGFDEWSEQNITLRKSNLPKAEEFLDKHGDEKFFLFAHGWDVHAPYVVPSRPPKYGNPPENIPVTWEELRESRRENRSWIEIRKELNKSRGSSDMRMVKNMYDSSVIHMDRGLGNFFRYLKDEGLYDRSMIIVMSDHGEQFGEHGRLGHFGFHRETIRVPLAVKFPGQERGVRVEEPVELRDLYPTVVEHAGGTAERGIPLQEVIRGESSHERIYSEKLWRRMVVDDGYKLFWRFRGNNSQYELYNIEEDPEELNDLSGNRTLLEKVNQSLSASHLTRVEGCDAETDLVPARYG